MCPCGLVRRQRACPGRKVSFLGHPGSRPSSPCIGLLWAWGLSSIYLKTAAPSVGLGLGCGHRTLLVCGFPLSGRNIGSVFWGQAPLVSLCRALPWKGHKGGVCVCVRACAGDRRPAQAPHEAHPVCCCCGCLFIQGQPCPSWVGPTERWPWALPGTTSRTGCHDCCLPPHPPHTVQNPQGLGWFLIAVSLR